METCLNKIFIKVQSSGLSASECRIQYGRIPAVISTREPITHHLPAFQASFTFYLKQCEFFRDNPMNLTSKKNNNPLQR